MNAPVDRGFNVAVIHIAGKLFPAGFDVSADAPETLEGLREHVARTGRMVVSSLHSEGTIFGCPEVNYAFRAWHDWCHLNGNHAFTVEGETDACYDQIGHLETLYGIRGITEWRRLLIAEVIGQAQYAELHGTFPTDQVAFDLAYIANHDVALANANA